MLTDTLYRPLGSPMAIVKGCLRFTGFFIIVTLFILHHEIVKLFIRDEIKRLRYFVKSVSLTSRLGFPLLKIDVNFKNIPENLPPGLIVSNHLSYLDVIILFSRFPALFITSKEIGDVFLLGRLTKLAGCFHVERRKHLRSEEMVRAELLSMKSKLSQGLSLFLFPEGTSSDGSTVLPYKAHFFQTAIDLDLPVTALCLKYDWEDRDPDELCWYGDMSFASHLFQVCCRGGIKASVEKVNFHHESAATRFEIAQIVREGTLECYERN